MSSGNSIISSSWLNEHLQAPDVKILDASWYLPTENRFPELEFKKEHIPGATFFDIDEICDSNSNLPHMLPSPEKFASRVRRLGIGDGHRVIIYDGSGLFSAARVWWMFRVFGFEDVALLDGGLPKWKELGFKVESKIKSVQEFHFTVRKNSLMVSDSTDIYEASTKGSAQIIDARARDRFLGEAPEPRPGLRSGHIPNSFNIPYPKLLNEDKTLKETEELIKIFEKAGIDINKPIISTCGSGVTAAIINLALEHLGARQVTLYDGSWCEWGSQDEFEVETG